MKEKGGGGSQRTAFADGLFPDGFFGFFRLGRGARLSLQEIPGFFSRVHFHQGVLQPVESDNGQPVDRACFAH